MIKQITYYFLIQLVVLVLALGLIFKVELVDINPYKLNMYAIIFQFFIGIVVGGGGLFALQDKDKVLGIYGVLGGATIKILFSLAFVLIAIKGIGLKDPLSFIASLFISYFIHTTITVVFFMRINALNDH